MQHLTHDHVNFTPFEVPHYFPDLITGAQIITGVRHYNVPGSTISIHLNVEERGSVFTFKKGDKILYINTCCLEGSNSRYLFEVIKTFARHVK